MIGAIVFDCDGTLVDSERLLVAIDQQVFRELGWDASLEEIAERFVGKAGADYDAAIHDALGPLPAGWRDPYVPLYERAMLEHLGPIDGIEAALQAIPLPKAVASNSYRANVLSSLTATGLLRYFGDRVVGFDDVAHGKPAPDVYIQAASRLGVAASQCIAVEDSTTGIASARAAGTTVLGFGGGLTPAARLEAAGARVFSAMSELPALVAELS